MPSRLPFRALQQRLVGTYGSTSPLSYTHTHMRASFFLTLPSSLLSPPSPPSSPSPLPFLYQETKKKQQLKVKMQMAKFLQSTIKDMAVSSKNRNKKESVEEFAQFFEKVVCLCTRDFFVCLYSSLLFVLSVSFCVHKHVYLDP